MYSIMRFFRAWILFLAFPIASMRLERAGKVRGEWNTWLLSGLKSAKREYGRSVTQMGCIWWGLVVTTMFMVGIHFLLSGKTELQGVIDIVGVALLCMWISLLTPQVLLSYEMWNWVKVLKFGSFHFEHGVRDAEQVQNLAKIFLASEAGVAFEKGHYEEFTHLEYVMKRVDLWKGKRQDILKYMKEGK